MQVRNGDLTCQYVSFSSKFSGDGTPVRVFASINHGNKSSGVHDLAFIWIEDVTTSRFKACLVQSGKNLESNSTMIDWFAFQGSQTGVSHGQAIFSFFTTGSQCNRYFFLRFCYLCALIYFSFLFLLNKPFTSIPKIHVTVQHGTLNQVQDAMNIWIANVSTNHFEVCLQESTTFDGLHDKLLVNWMAYEHYPLSWEAKESSAVSFSENEVPSTRDSYALCKNVTFSIPFYSAPLLITTVINGDGNNANNACSVKGPIITWLEEVTTSYFRVCIKDSAGYDGQRSKVLVDYLLFGAFVFSFCSKQMNMSIADLDPCSNASCKYHSHCVSLSPNQFTCACEGSCPSYEEQVCASNGRTFTNLCLLKQEICRTRGNYTKYHPGSCIGTFLFKSKTFKSAYIKYLNLKILLCFPLQKGRHQFGNVPSWAEDQCEVIQFKSFIFYPDQKIYVQLTVNHVNYSDSTVVHEATTPWVESVNSTQFTACVTRAGRNDYPSDSFATVDWVAYQGAPSGGVAGEKWFSRWWTGTSCQKVTFAKGKFSQPPTIFATAEHHRSRLKHDATSLWMEDVSVNSFKICLRELQNFAGVHDDISVNWLAFESLHRPLFSEHSDVNFQNNLSPSEIYNFAFCKDVSFKRSYEKSPTVLVTAKHSIKGGKVAAECNGIVSWTEFITPSRFRICVKELFIQHYDPLLVSYAVLSDVCEEKWKYFNGYCYRKVSSCDSWTNSQGTCAALGANLPSIHSQEENVYVQSLHGGEYSWLGLFDINTEGKFVWSDGTSYDFHYWAEHQPNNFHDEDCIHTLGFLQDHRYEWNDVNCSDCHRFTCKKDFNECNDFFNDCPVNTSCVNSDGSYACRCPIGFRLEGKNCSDVDECSSGSFSCHAKAKCVNTPGSYSCICSAGYKGDGKINCTIPSFSFRNRVTCNTEQTRRANEHFFSTCLSVFFQMLNVLDFQSTANCAGLYKSGKTTSGVYSIDPDGSGAFDVYCDQTTAGGGWVVFQKRQDGSVDFYRGWIDYKNGFGNLNGEFWLGLDKIHRLTKTKNKLRVDLMDTTGSTAYAEYNMFSVSSERTKYKLSLGTYSGRRRINCAMTYKGAWWYKYCHRSNLNGLYHHGKHSSYADGVHWYHWKGYNYSVKRAEMKIRPA
ncbi:unnamed protein product [Pocillopora meandrina]|uniref:Uncharacterized protein n=1 Tax=Pocillopora meandrina TaxID=46732 RepID=A0AAU9W9X0_9CNID|nr:unnamed protein product [Pocillopora meandrina]